MKNYWLLFVILLMTAMTLNAQPSHTLSEVQVEQIEPFRYAALEMIGDYQQHSEAFPKIYELAVSQNLGYAVEVFGIYFNDPSQVPVEQLEWELGFQLAEGQTVKEPLVEKKWDYAQVATITYAGPFTDEMGSALEALFSWVMSNGYTPAGPKMQKYVGMPTQNERGEWAGTIVSILPVQK